MKSNFSFSVFATVAVSLSSCSPNQYFSQIESSFDGEGTTSSRVGVGPAPVKGSVVSETLNARDAGNQIDMLFIVDSSGSMKNPQEELKDSIAAFTKEFTDSGLDFHLGVTTTDTGFGGGDSKYADPFQLEGLINSSASEFSLRDYAGFVKGGVGQLFTKQASYPFLTSTTPNLDQLMTSNILVGTNGSGVETGLGAIYQFFNRANLSGPNAGFMRNSAFLYIVIISDEDESTTFGGINYNDAAALPYIGGVKSLLLSLKGNSFTVDFILDPRGRPGRQSMTFPQNTYNAAAKLWESQVFDLESPFGSALVTRAGSLASQIKSTFTLKAVPRPGTLTVKVGGTLIPQSTSNGWGLSGNTLRLYGTAYNSVMGGAPLNVTYTAS